MFQYEELSQSLKESLMAKIQTVAPFWGLLGMELVDVRKGWAKVRLPFTKKLTHALGIAHGGAVFAPADSAIAMALLGLVGRSKTFSTVEMKINFIRPFAGGEIVAEAKIVHKGTNLAIGDVEVVNGEGQLVAKGVATFMIVHREMHRPGDRSKVEPTESV